MSDIENSCSVFTFKASLPYIKALNYVWHFTEATPSRLTNIIKDLHDLLFQFKIKFESSLEFDSCSDPQVLKSTLHIIFEDTQHILTDEWKIQNCRPILTFQRYLRETNQTWNFTHLKSKNEVIKTLLQFEEYDTVASNMSDYRYPVMYNKHPIHP